MKFNIRVLDTNIHTQCFAEVADSVAWVLQLLGHDVARSQTFIGDGVNVLFGVRPGESALPENSIIYNGEQVGSDGMWPSLVDLYKRHTVWDYSAANAARYKEWGLVEPRVVRPGYAPVLDGRIEQAEKVVDVVFFGSLNERRKKILDDLQDKGLKVMQVPFGVYGRDRDDLIAQAKLCVNIHYYESAIFEAVRCSYLAQNGVPVISESSVAGENNQWGISGISYKSLVSFVCSALDGDLETYGKSLREAARRVSLLDDVRAALASQASGSATTATSYPTIQPKRTSVPITLCMIVKNETDVIERCLASVRPLITRWCIVDTGSTDGTQDLIRKIMADVPGQLHECSWKEFDGSRSEAVDLARAECQNEGWLMTLDADEFVELEQDLEIPDGHDCHNAWVTFGAGRWARPMFMRANKPWFFEMPRHEALYCRTWAPTAPTPIAGLLVMSTREGARAKEGARERYERDAQVLEAWSLQHPNHSRCTFYIAQSYNWAAEATSPPDRALSQKAVMYYLKRAEMATDHPQETFAARYLAGQLMVRLGYPWERIQHTFLQAYALGTSRAEPLYNIARYYREMGDQERSAGKPAAGMYALAELFARKASQIGPSEHMTADVDHTVNDWRAKDELATALTYLNGHAEARDLFRHILRCPDIAPHDRARIEANLELCKRLAPDPA